MSRKILTQEHALEFLNGKYFMSAYSGQFRIYQEQLNRITRRIDLAPMGARDFCDDHDHLGVSEGDKVVAVGRWWIQHQDARRYTEVVFEPNPVERKKLLTQPQVFNLFRGFDTREKEGAWDLIHYHILHVLANGDERMYAFILEWFAHVVQKPHLSPGLALALKGTQGSGKSTVGRIVEKLIGPQHYLPVSQASQVVGRFNGHLADRIVVFSDEAFWAGDVQGLAAMKTLITEPTLTLENKFGRVERVRNSVHLLMATNADWVVPMEIGDRRFVVSVVSDRHVRDHAYFEALYREIDGPALAAFMYHVARIPVKDRLEKPRDSYVAAAAAHDQVRRAFDPFNTWLDDRLMSGVLIQDGPTDWPLEVEKSTLYADYLNEARRLGTKYPMSEGRFGRQLKAVLGHVSSEIPGFKDYRPWAQGATRRPRFWIVPPLEACRERFTKLVMGPDYPYDFYAGADDRTEHELAI